MKILFDYFPIIIFFVAFKFYGIYVATAATIIAAFLQNAAYWLKYRKFEKLYLITFLIILVLGGITLIFHRAIFIKWKPSIVYWLFAVALLIAQWFSKKNLLARMLGSKIALPDKIWHRLSTAWAIFFLFLGVLNLYVVYHYSTNSWVNFKLFGTLGLTLAFSIAQAIYMARHVIHKET